MMINGNFSSTLRQLVAGFDQKIHQAKTEVQRLEGLRRAAIILLENESTAGSKDRPAPTPDKPYTGMTAIDGAEMILRKHGNQAMHVSEILKALLDGGWVTKARHPKLTVAGSLFREKRFEKMGGNKFRLKDYMEESPVPPIRGHRPRVEKSGIEDSE